MSIQTSPLKHPPTQRGRFAVSGTSEFSPIETLPWGKTDRLYLLILGIIGLITRFIGLGATTDNGTPIFDEKHYVPQGFDILSSTGFFQPGVETNPGYGLVVHPPLSKQLIAIGEAIFGYSPWGWRLMTALFGVAMILLIYAIARQLSNSPTIGLYAGIIACADGVLLVSSRFGMLDIFLAFFVGLAMFFLIVDFQLGVPGSWRWWRFAAGVALGMAVSIKWSGLYFMAFFGLFTVALDWWKRRNLTRTLLIDAPRAFFSIVIVPVLLYLWSWRGWFASETGTFRHAHAAGDTDLPGGAFANFIYYHQQVLKFHSSLTTSSGHSHPWDSKPPSWLAATRPILYSSGEASQCAIGPGDCNNRIYLFGTPIIWWLTVPVLLFCVYWLITRRDLRFSFPVVGFAAAWLPWLAVYDRQMYFFYAVPAIGFTIVGIALILGIVPTVVTNLGGTRKLANTLVVVYLTAVVISFVWFSPILYGFRIPEELYNTIMVLPSWR